MTLSVKSFVCRRPDRRSKTTLLMLIDVPRALNEVVDGSSPDRTFLLFFPIEETNDLFVNTILNRKLNFEIEFDYLTVLFVCEARHVEKRLVGAK